MRFLHLIVGTIAVACLSATSALSEYPRSKANHEMNYGLDYLRDGKYDLSESYFKMAAVVQKDKAEAMFLLGIAHLAQQEWEQGNAALTEAYALKPALKGNIERVWRDVGIPAPAPAQVLASARAPTRNQRSVESSTAMKSSTTRPWTGLVYSSNAPEPGTAARELFDGKDYLRNNMPATAKDVLLRAIKSDPTQAEAHFWLSGAYRALGDAAAAKRHLNRAYSLDSSLRAHEAELSRFGSANQTISSKLKSKPANQCQALYATCMTSATRCTMRGCETDFGRQAVCTGERRQCEHRNSR